MLPIEYAVSSIGKDTHSDRISVLNQITDKYNYEDMVFQPDNNSIEVFAERNKVCLFIYEFDPEKNDVRLSKPGHIDYLNNDLMYLLRID